MGQNGIGFDGTWSPQNSTLEGIRRKGTSIASPE